MRLVFGLVIASYSKRLIFGAIILNYDVLIFLGSFVTFVVGKFVKFWRSRIYYSVEFVLVKNLFSRFLRFFGGGLPLGIVHMEQDRT